MSQDRSIRIAGLCGSLRPGSFTKMALAIALQGAAPTSEIDLIDLRDFDLPMATGEGDPEDPSHDVYRLRERIKLADGVIVGTPEYHGSFSGVLKNALDLTGFKEWEGKMVALVGVSGGRLGGNDAINSLRHIGRTLHAWVIPEQVSIPEAHRAFGTDGRLKDTKLEQRLVETGRQIARFAYLHKCAANNDFLVNWEKAQPNPGA